MRVTLAATCALALLTLPACIGYDRMLFTTKSNVGVDLDSTPPTFDVTIARREVVIEPTFDNAETLPVMASFSSKVGGIGRFFGGVAMTFATGDAAIAMARYAGTNLVAPPVKDGDAGLNGDVESAVDVGSSLPGGGKLFKTSPYTNGNSTPLVFGTDSSLGLKVGWSGMDLYPNTLKFGFNRKEIAIAPVFATSSGSAETTKFTAKAPSLLATVNSDTSIGKASAEEKNQVVYLQYFATGKAATLLALNPNVRGPVVNQMVGGSLDALVDQNRGLAAQLENKIQALTQDHAQVLEAIKTELVSMALPTWSQMNDFAAKKSAVIAKLKEKDFAQPSKEQSAELMRAYAVLVKEGLAQ